MQLRFAPSLLGLALLTACASAPVAGPAIEIESSHGVRAAHARLLPGEAALEVELRAAFVTLPGQRLVTVEGVAADGRVLFRREAKARATSIDARYHRETRSRARVELPELSEVAGLRVHAGR